MDYHDWMGDCYPYLFMACIPEGGVMSDWFCLHDVKVMTDQGLTDLPKANTLDFPVQERGSFTLPNNVTFVLFELKMNSMKALPFLYKPEYPLN
jgi:hypothetical protein